MFRKAFAKKYSRKALASGMTIKHGDNNDITIDMTKVKIRNHQKWKKEKTETFYRN
jgi:hypothetical protein